MILKQHIKNIAGLGNRRTFAILYNPKTTQSYKEETIKVSKWNVNYLKVGNGPHTVLCIPGVLGTIWTDFKPQVEGLDRERFTWVFWDHPGFGKSSPPEYSFPRDYPEKGADLVYEFMNALKIPKYSVLGWSLGGIYSILLAAKYPDAVNKLAVTGTLSVITPEIINAMKELSNIDRWEKNMRETFVAIYGQDLLLKYWVQCTESMEYVYNVKGGNVVADCLKNIKCETLIVQGEKDPIIHSKHAHYLHKNIKKSRLLLYPEGKHNVHLAYSDDFNKKFEEFLESPKTPE